MSASNIPQDNRSSNDEIDIFEFCSRIWKTFKDFIISVKDLIVSIIIFLIRKSLWIVTFAIAGVLLGYLLYGVSKPRYSSSLEGNTGDLDNTVVIDHVNKLNQLTGKPKLLAPYLNIREEQARAIGSIKAYYGIDINRDKKPDYTDFKETYNPRDTTQVRVPSYIYLKVTVYDENILPLLRKNILLYINSSSYLQELSRINRQQKEALISEIESEISKIDSLQRSRYRKGAQSDNTQMFFLGNESGLRLFHDDVLSLYKQKQTLERELKISDEIIVVVQDFMPLAQEVSPVLNYILTFGGVMAVVGIFCALIWQYRKKVWKLIKEDSSGR